MTRIANFLRIVFDIGFHAFLAAYWYLVHALFPSYALAAAAVSYLLFIALRSRFEWTLPPAVLVPLSAVLFFLMLNPVPSLYGVTLLVWFAASAVAFRLCFHRLQSASLKIGALLASYLIFLALPLGMPRLGPTAPSAQEGEPLDIVIVGAGFGGVAMGKELLDAGITNFRIYEGAPSVGGTWWHNRYPGLHVDVQSALYSFSFYPNPHWSRRWAPRDELLDYSIRAADAVGVTPFVQLNTWVQGAAFNESSGLWEVSFGEDTVQANHLVLATGGLHIPNTPRFAGLEAYRGDTFHSARWRDDVELSGKRIAVIGSGASAVQLIPEILKTAAQVDMYQRTPNWISPRDNRYVSPTRQLVYQYVPMAYKLQRLRTHAMSELGYRAVFPLASSRRARVEEYLTNYIRTTVDDEELVPKLIPDYEFGCKRPLIIGEFYPSLNRPNMNVVTEGIERFTTRGIMSRAGTEREYDVVIMATGYRLAELPFPVTSRNGLSLAQLWAEKPLAYESIMVHGFPNLYLMSGPNSGVFGSIIIHIESAAGYMAQVIRRAGDALLVEPTLEAQQAYNREIQAGLQETVWAGSCKSWYKLEDGHVIANHPDPISEIVYDRARPRWEDFIVTRRTSSAQ
jgi:cation diffusion facilitator CzcD-associated flavoprotein CzcO